MQQWLRRPPLTITLSPGQRDAYTEAKVAAAAPPKPPQAGTAAAKPTRTPPPLGQLSALKWPTITHTTLANGIPVVYAQRTTVPLTQLALSFDAGSAADSADRRGLAGVTAGMLDEGTVKYTSQQLAEAEERLGADISSGGSADRTAVTLSALSPNLSQSLDLLAEIAERPAFAPADLDRVRSQALTGLAQTMKDPTRVGNRVLPAAIYGASHPYGAPPGGDVQALTALTRDDLVSFQQRWLRPDNLKIFVVSDRPLTEVKTELESRFGMWAPPAVAKGVKAFPALTPRPAAQRILLIDRPGAPQSTIIGGQILPVDPRGDTVPLFTANQVLGSDFLSRLNMDLRETKGWSYGVGGNANLLVNAVSYTVSAPVQADRTGESLAALNADISDFLSTKGVTQDELEGNVTNLVNGLPGEFETSSALLQAMMRNDLLGRPDNYYEGLPTRYRAQTTASLDRAARQAIDPKGFVWVVVGDAAKIRPQLDKLGLPIEVVQPR
jgi:predicted Zn-dependent peptidase